MSLRNRLEQHSSSLEDKDAPPVSVTISETDGETFDLNSIWMEERERTSLLAEESAEVESDVLPSTYYNSVEDAELRSELAEVFADIRSVISVSDAWNVHHFSFSTLAERETESEFENPFAPEWADYGAMAFVTNEQDTVSESGRDILDLILQEISEIDAELSVEDLNTVELHFSDWQACHLQSIHVNVETTVPHRFYQGVDSVDEYISAIADSEDEVSELQAADQYEVFVRLDDPSGDGSEIETELVELAESVMTERATTAVDADVQWFYESQSIVFNTDSGVAEQTAFYLRVPFCSEK